MNLTEPIANESASATASSPHSRQIKSGRGFPSPERLCLAVLLAIFIAFTWRGLLMYYSLDDMMNMHWAWTWDHWTLGWANLLVWIPVYRPLGETIYLVFYAFFGFQPTPLYIFCWLLLIANVFAAYAFLRSFFSVAVEALIALALILVHGAYIDLYNSAGTIFDRLCFFFTALGLTVYVRTRKSAQTISLARGVVLWLLCVLAMDSKESGVTLPVMFACYECIFVLPSEWRGKAVGKWLRSIGPFYLILAVTSLTFVFARVLRTPELAGTNTYHPRVSAVLWLGNVANYFDQLVYRHVLFTAVTAAGVLLVMAAAAILLRNRIMMFGWLWFAITITPVALIAPRPGYVLCVPVLGLGLYLGAILAAAVRGLSGMLPVSASAIGYAVFAGITIATTWCHAVHWPGFPEGKSSLVFGLADQFRREYPTLKRGSKLLFASDYFAIDTWGITQTLRLLYRDRSLDVRRLNAMPDQQPEEGKPLEFDYVFATAAGRYEELDNRDAEESIRLHILRGYSVGRATAFSHRDHGAYVVSGVMDSEGPDLGRWTTPQAKLKFDVYPADSMLSLHYWVPDFVAAAPVKTLTVRVNGNVVGSVPLTKDGDNQLRFPVKAGQISRSGFTIVDLDVDKPYKGADGVEFGVVLFDAGFEYQPRR